MEWLYIKVIYRALAIKTSSMNRTSKKNTGQGRDTGVMAVYMV